MSERKINLEEILIKEIRRVYGEFKPVEDFCERDKTIAKRAMKEACRQIVELVAENADLNYCENEWEVPEGTINTGDSQYGYHYIDKQSILNTIKQIE